jgi:hypothetical protein
MEMDMANEMKEMEDLCVGSSALAKGERAVAGSVLPFSSFAIKRRRYAAIVPTPPSDRDANFSKCRSFSIL